MHKALCVARREYLAAVRTKGFIITLVAMPVLMCGSLIGFALMRGQVDTRDKRVAIVDHTGVLASAVVEAATKRNADEVQDKKSGKKIRPAYVVQVVAPTPTNLLAQRLELSEQVRKGQLHAFVEVGAKVIQPEPRDDTAAIRYHAKNPALDEIRRWIGGPLNDRIRRFRLEAAGLEEAKVRHIFEYMAVEPMGLVTTDSKTGEVKQAKRTNELEAIGVPIALVMLLYVMILMSAMPMLNAVMEEKMHRIAEVLLGSVAPFPLMLGKLLGGVAVALTASSFYIAGGLFTLSQMSLMAMVPYALLPWFFAYLVLSVFMMGAIFTAVGSACSDPKDAQSLTLPAMLPILIPMFLLGPLLQQPQSPMATGLSLFPPFTPMLMLLRQSMPGGVPAWQPWVGLAGVVLFTLLSVWASGRIFESECSFREKRRARSS